ncbi:MAG: hypothetical protein Q3983_06165 [Capnocytophaga sp.]|nr:hypothetical protein [Capnocytophaga sp.]
MNTNNLKNAILFIALFLSTSFQTLLAQEEAQELKTENKSEIIQEK